jgi:hypothetical protein
MTRQLVLLLALSVALVLRVLRLRLSFFAGILPFCHPFSKVVSLREDTFVQDVLTSISAFPVNLSANQSYPMRMPSSQMISKPKLPGNQGNQLSENGQIVRTREYGV